MGRAHDRGRSGAIALARAGQPGALCSRSRFRHHRDCARRTRSPDRALRVDRASGQRGRERTAAATTASRNRTPARTWLIARDAAGYSADLGQALGAALAAAGQRVVTVMAAPIYAQIDPSCHALDPCDPAHWDRLLAALRDIGEEPQGWIHLVGLDLATASALARGARRCARGARRRLHGMVADLRTAQSPTGVLGHRRSCRDGAAADGGARCRRTAAPLVDPLRDAALWGISRVAMQEFTDLRIRWLDLHDPLPCAPNAAKLAEEILHPDTEDEILLTAAGRYVPRLVHSPAAAAAGLPQPSASAARAARLLGTRAFSQSQVARRP